MAVKSPSNFEDLLEDFTTSMESFRKFIPMTFAMSPFILKAMAGRKLKQFASHKGEQRPDLSKENFKVFEIASDCFQELRRITDELDASIQGTNILPELGIIGLISAYDAFLANLIKITCTMHSEIFFTSQKQVLFSDLIKFSSLEEAKESLLDREVDSVIRSSHSEQFTWMEKNFDVKLREGLTVWPAFMELCERRNLLTHTGGIVSKQYLSNCENFKTSVKDIKVGDKLEISSEYYQKAVEVVYEIGVKLCYVIWRKFNKPQVDKADRKVSNLTFNLIHSREYKLAEAILRFAVDIKGKREENTLGMMIINLANALRLQNRLSDAKNVLSVKDWSGSSRALKLGVAAVSEDMTAVAQLMKEVGKNGDISAEDYRTWPIFRGLRDRAEFDQAFKSIFRENLIRPKNSIQATESGASDISSVPLTKH